MSGAWAANVTWTGAEDNYWNNTNNWKDKDNDSSCPLPTNDSMFFDSQYFNERFTENEVVFDGVFANDYVSYVRNVGTAEAPLVFRATVPEYGLQFGNRTNKNNGIGDATGDAYLRFEGGTWSTGVGVLNIGGSSTFGQVALADGATFTVGSTLTIANGELNLADGSTFSTGNDIYLNNVASKVNISGGSALTGGRYFCLRNGEVTVANATLQNTAYNFELGEYAAVTLTLNAGGVLYVRQIANKTYGGTVLLNGGEIKASYAKLASDNDVIVVKVGEGGGVINANGLAVSFPRPIAADGVNDGGMTFKGGGSVSLKYANTYTGATKVELGTKIIATTADAKASVLANLVVTGVAADGDYYPFEYSGLTDADLANVTCPGGAEGTTITRDGNQIKVHYVAPAEGLGWNGGDAAWATANAWTNATGTAKTWMDGNYAVFEDASTVTLGANATAVAATFNADATVAVGGGTLTVPTVTVASGVSATIAAPTAGALEKDGAGMLTLGSSRTDATTLTEGTLAMANGATLAALTLGTDSAKPVTLDYGGGTYATKLADINGGLDVTLKNGTFQLNKTIKKGTLRVAADAAMSTSGDLVVGDDASANGTLTMDGTFFNVGIYLYIANVAGGTGDMVVNNGNVAANRLILGQKGTGTLTINGGSLEVRSSDGSAYVGKLNGTVVLNGGTLIAKTVIHDGGTSSLVFNGGTLKANAVENSGLIQSAIPVTVNAGGGTIDAATLDVTVKATSVTGAGGMKYAGGGSVTYSVQPAYTGVTTVEVGTTLVVPEAIAGEKLAFTIPDGLAKGVYEVVRISGGGGFADSVLTDAALPQDENAQFRLNSAKTSIICAYGYEPGENAYIGGNNGNLSAPDNWTTGVVPTSGEVKFDFAAATTLIVGDTFRADTITIPSSSAVVTIGSGDLHLAGSLTNANRLAIAQDASLTVDGDLVVGNGQGTFLYSNEGTVTVKGNAVCANTTTTTTTKQFEVVTENTQPIQAAGLLYNLVQSGRIYWRLESHSTGAGAWVVGENGLNFINPENRNSTRFYAQDNPVTLYSSADWKLANTGKSSTSNGDLEVYGNSSLTIDTTDYTDKTTPRTVTLEGRIKADGNVTIAGSGTVVVATTDNPSGLTETTVASGKTIAVTDTATLKVNAGKKILGAGTISLAAGTTLAFESTASTFVTPDIVPVTLPAEGAATISIDGTRLCSGEHVLCVLASVPENLADHVTVSGTALDGRKYEVKAVEVTENETTIHKLVIDIYPDGLRVIIR